MTISAVVLPNGRTQFFDDAGVVLAGGSVGYYIPTTETFKTTWQDPEASVLNENPVPLDAAGSALIWGSGEYRMIVKDALGVTIFDVLTYGNAPASAAGETGFAAQESIVAGATIDLGSIGSHNALITGATTCASFGDSASLDAPIYLCTVDTGFTAANSADLTLPGEADYTFASGDTFFAEFLGDGSWRVFAITPAIGLNQGFGLQETLASAATVDLGTGLTNNALITGVVGVTSFGNSALLSRPIWKVEFAGVLVLTDSAGLQLPGNITTQAGDTAEFEFLGTSTWKLRDYQRADGTALVVTQILQRTFLATANGAFDFTLPATVTPTTRVKFTLCAPGGGGAGCSAGDNGGGSGGGAGGYWQGVVYGFAGGAHVTGTVGAAGGAGGTNANGSPGAALTKFTYAAVDVVSCAVGAGGIKDAGAGGAGGAVTTNFTGLTLEAAIQSLALAGFAGSYGGSSVNISGAGASLPMGEGGAARMVASGGAGLAGYAARGYGAGGGGAVGAAAAVGGTGAPGFFLMELLA